MNAADHRNPAAATSSAAVVAGVSHSQLFGDLPGVGLEVERVAALLGVDAVPEPQVTPAELLGRSGRTRYLHLACHGRFSWNSDPLDSALYLADDEPLTLADVIGRFDLSARLVTLSACESGVVEFERTPDEFFGLTAGFLQAGAAGVLSSLWRVDDMSTTLLMERFYRELVDGKCHPAVALERAQVWLRRLTRDDASRHMRDRGHHAEARHVLVPGHRDEPASDHPYEHPYYWAAFTYSGA